ncbi:MAG: hydantoinase B/oxoprolinase family protein [Anaerolineales bacterium]|nr:hydantoinase B/oxoprolinase family protein [Anaerolineales bacterium]
MIDPVMTQVIRNGLDSVAEQMGIAFRRTAIAPLIREALDFATALFDRNGCLISQSSRIPLFVNAMGPTLRFVLENCLPLSDWKDGDIILLNDPYLGGSQHLPDLATFMPIFSDGVLIGVAGAIGHHVDLGGIAPGSYAMSSVEIFQEGLRIPPVHLYRQGQLVPEVKALLLGNVRLPDQLWADLNAQIAAMKIGYRGFVELVERFSLDSVEQATEELLDYSDALMKAGIAKIPNGSYEFVDWLDDDGRSDEPVKIAVSLTVEDDSITADFTGTSEQRRSPINGSLAMLMAVLHYAIVAAVAPDIPVNEGCFRRIRVLAPEGTVVNAQPPVPVVGRIALCHRVCDVIIGALAQAIPQLVPAGFYGMSNIYTIAGIEPDGTASWITMEILVGGWGGRDGADGLEACAAHVHNASNTPIEMVERLYPIRVEKYCLRDIAAGAGRYRGGSGLVREFRLLSGEATLSIHGDRIKFPPYGLVGGKSGAPAVWLLNRGTDRERALYGKEASIKMQAGDTLTVETQTGGGYGDPIERDARAIARDVDFGKLTRGKATELYGSEWQSVV